MPCYCCGSFEGDRLLAVQEDKEALQAKNTYLTRLLCSSVRRMVKKDVTIPRAVARWWTLLAERDEAPKHIANAIDATREERATMRAAVERCAELERHEETWKAEFDITAAWQERATKAEAELVSMNAATDGLCDVYEVTAGKLRAAVERCAELEVLADGRSEALDVAIGKINKAEAELAKVTVELDEARRMAEIRLRAIESIRHASLRATPTEGE